MDFKLCILFCVLQALTIKTYAENNVTGSPESTESATTEMYTEIVTNSVTETVDVSTVPSTTEIVLESTTEEDPFAELLSLLESEENTELKETTTNVPKKKTIATTKRPIESTKKSTTTPKPKSPEERINKLSDQIRLVLENYQKHGSVTVPGADIPDPMPVPDIKKTFAKNPISFTGVVVYGLSNFTVDHINTDLDKMQVYVSLYIERLVILGNYSIKSWLTRASGPFNVTLLDVEASGAAQLTRDEKGNLQATDTEMDMTFMDNKVDFKNLGMIGGLLQGIVASAGPLLFDSIKPIILAEVNTKIRTDINDKIRTLGEKMSATGNIPPLDLAVAEGRKYVKNNGYDPYSVQDSNITHGLLSVNITNFSLAGLSRFYRVGEVGLSMDNGTVQMTVHIATKELLGECRWVITVGKTYKRAGDLNFTISHLQIKSTVNQSLDVRQHPVLNDLDIYLGKITLRLDGKGKFDFLVESVVNSFPTLLRHIIVDALEGPIKGRVQKLLNDIDVNDILEKGLPELDNMGL